MKRAGLRSALAIAVAMGFGVVTAGAALAVSGGGYNPDQQDCTPSADNTGSFNYVQPGCHNGAVNLETGGTTNGNPNSDNTRFAEIGVDQNPQVPGNPSFGTLYNLGDPGTPGAVHAGCAAVNTDGTTGGTGTGCGDNQKGAGFSSTWDYYDVYCPATDPLPLSSVPWPGRLPNPDPTGLLPLDPPGLPALYNCGKHTPGTHVTNDQGTSQKLSDIATKGLLLYIGMDDNNDNGEHDGFLVTPTTNGAINGPSDGGGITTSVTPQNAATTPTGHNPEGIANLSFGFCADGICTATTTQRQTVYYGCNAPGTPPGTYTTKTIHGKGNGNGNTQTTYTPGPDECSPGQANSSADVYKNQSPASTQEQANCQSGNDPRPPNPPTPTACYTNADGSPNPGGPNTYRQQTAHTNNVEPGVQTYQDPDPQRSPAAPFGMPGAYVGTCGVYANDGSSTVGPSVTGFVTGQISGNGGPKIPDPVTTATGGSHTIVDTTKSGLC